MKITLLTIFPEYFTTPLRTSILKRAAEQNLVEYHLVDIRSFTTDKHHTTDDRPFGGGPGMVMKVEPIDAALRHLELGPYTPPARRATTRTVLTSAKGEVYTQATARTYARLSQLAIICGHYEGVDERVAEHLVDAELRIGDYVLTGGEAAALVVVDSVVRLLPSVLGNEASTVEESHSTPGKLGFPQYTRPEEYRGWRVPRVLLGGDHAAVKNWRNAQVKGVLG